MRAIGRFVVVASLVLYSVALFVLTVPLGHPSGKEKNDGDNHM